jgi:hypothetical protein
MRFLFNNSEAFDLTILMVMRGLKVSNFSGSDREKMKTLLKQLLEDYFNYHKYEELMKKSREFNDLSDD